MTKAPENHTVCKIKCVAFSRLFSTLVFAAVLSSFADARRAPTSGKDALDTYNLKAERYVDHWLQGSEIRPTGYLYVDYQGQKKLNAISKGEGNVAHHSVDNTSAIVRPLPTVRTQIKRFQNSN